MYDDLTTGTERISPKELLLALFSQNPTSIELGAAVGLYPHTFFRQLHQPDRRNKFIYRLLLDIDSDANFDLQQTVMSGCVTNCSPPPQRIQVNTGKLMTQYGENMALWRLLPASAAEYEAPVKARVLL